MTSNIIETHLPINYFDSKALKILYNIQIFAKMLKKISNNLNYFDNHSIYQKTQKLVFIYQEIDVKTAISFITDLAQFSQISFQKFSNLLNFALCINQDRFFKV